jgi:hypothetical protein
MNDNTIWLLIIATVSILFLYEVVFVIIQRRNPGALARTAHTMLRDDWFNAISQNPASEIIAIQTLRNSLMSATMTASTAAIALIGTATLATPSLHGVLGSPHTTLVQFTPQLALELILMTALFASLVCSAMAIRYYNHAGYICSMPIGSEERRRWSSTCASHLRRAGLLYSWGLRHFVLVAPILAAILYPPAGPIVAVMDVVILYGFDKING